MSTAPSAIGVTTMLYPVELSAVNDDLVPLDTQKSPAVTPVTDSENVARTVNAPLVGFGAVVVRVTVGSVPS